MLVAGAAAAIALPTSLPFAVFAMDFGKEGAAVLSSLLSALGFCAQLLSLRLLPRLQRARGWHAVFACLAGHERAFESCLQAQVLEAATLCMKGNLMC